MKNAPATIEVAAVFGETKNLGNEAPLTDRTVAMSFLFRNAILFFLACLGRGVGCSSG